MVSRRPVSAIGAVPPKVRLKVWERLANNAIGIRHLIPRSLAIDVAHTIGPRRLIPNLDSLIHLIGVNYRL